MGDTTSSLDCFSCPTYILSTGSAAGAIPLGVFVVSNEISSTITNGPDLLNSVKPSGAFSEKETTLVLPDKLASQHEALRKVYVCNVWSNARQLLCLFQYLQCW